MQNEIKTFIKKTTIVVIAFVVLFLFLFNLISHQINKIEIINDPLGKIEKEIIRAATGEGIQIEESQELLDSLRIIYNRDFKIIMEEINKPNSDGLSE